MSSVSKSSVYSIPEVYLPNTISNNYRAVSIGEQWMFSRGIPVKRKNPKFFIAVISWWIKDIFKH